MVSLDPFFVPTRSSLGKSTSYETVTFKNSKNLSNHSKRNELSNPVSVPEIDMKKVRFEVYKFAQNALEGEDKQKSKVKLAIKLGAKPPRNKYKNYKVLKEDLKKELEKAEENKELYNIPIKHRVSIHKSKLNKGALGRKRKIGSGILNMYGKATQKKR